MDNQEESRQLETKPTREIRKKEEGKIPCKREQYIRIFD
jgi:hypothetical protein